MRMSVFVRSMLLGVPLGGCLMLGGLGLVTGSMGCGARGGKAPSEGPAATVATVAGLAAEPRPADAQRSTATPRGSTLDDPSAFERTLVTSYSASLRVRDTQAAMSELERIVSSVDGQLSYASASLSSASASGSVRPDQFAAFSRALRELGLQVNSENRSSNDIGPELARLRQRHAALEAAHSSIEVSLHGEASMRPEASAVVHELVVNEKRSVEQQLRNYEKQLGAISFSVSMSRAS